MNPMHAQVMIEYRQQEAARVNGKPGWLARFEKIERKKS